MDSQSFINNEAGNTTLMYADTGEKHACITDSGKLLRVFATKEFAELLLTTPGTLYTFATTLRDVHKDSLKTVSPWPWYGVTIQRIFDVYNVLINRWTLDGGAPFMFDLPMYDVYKDKLSEISESNGIPDELLNTMVEGLTRFNQLHSEEPDTWYVDDVNYDAVDVSYISSSSFLK